GASALEERPRLDAVRFQPGRAQHDGPPAGPPHPQRPRPPGHGPPVRSVLHAQRAASGPRPRRGARAPGRGGVMEDTVIAKPAALPARSGTRRRSWLFALATAGIAVGLAARFSPEGPRAAPPSREMTVAPNVSPQASGNAIAIAGGAPQWQFVKLGRAEASAERWTDPVPARLAVDQAPASQVR